MTDQRVPAGIDVSRPSVARMYDYYLGGKDNFAVDREAAEEALKAVPEGKRVMRANRAFLGRAVRYLAEQGIRQFVDIGTGLPTQGNVHEVAQAAAPDARVVYVDNDPIVLAHGRALLETDERTTVVQADMREPETILDHPELAALIDFTQPVAVLFLAVLHFVPEEGHPERIVQAFSERMVPGSHLVISHITADRADDAAKVSQAYGRASAQTTFRSRDEIEALFEGFDLVDPGLVYVAEWRPDGSEDAERAWVLAGVGRKS